MPGGCWAEARYESLHALSTGETFKRVACNHFSSLWQHMGSSSEAQQLTSTHREHVLQPDDMLHMARDMGTQMSCRRMHSRTAQGPVALGGMESGVRHAPHPWRAGHIIYGQVEPTLMAWTRSSRSGLQGRRLHRNVGH